MPPFCTLPLARNRGSVFAKAVFAARFSRGLDVGTGDTLAAVAEEIGLDPAELI